MNDTISKGASDGLDFTGECMMPGQSLDARMELEHWNRYLAFYPLARSGAVLDAACGEGYGIHLLSMAASRATGVDLSLQNVKHARARYGAARPNLEYFVGDIRDLPIREHVFDVVFSFETIEHLHDIPQALSHFSRILRGKGIVVLSTPLPRVDPDTGKPCNPYHVRELNDDELMDHLGRYFPHVALLGQSRAFPSAVHRGFDRTRDAFVIALASDDERTLQEAKALIPDGETVSVLEQLFRRHHGEREQCLRELLKAKEWFLQQIENHKAALALRDEENGRLQGEVARLRDDLAMEREKARAETAAVRQELSVKNNELDSIHHSKWWKVAHAVRRARHLFGALIRLPLRVVRSIVRRPI
ncbi:MAG: class I SAM-dependent methyltransferase [Chlamydiota bacterium]